MTSDLSVLEEFGASLAPAHDHPPAEVRHRVLNGMRPPARRPRLSSRLTGVRLAWRIGAPAVVAAAVAGALVAGQLVGVAEPAPAPIDQGANPVRPARPDAAQVLQLAAQHAAGTPEWDARPDQFLFIDSVEVESKTSSGRTTVSRPLPTRTWLSVDGTRDGLVLREGTRTRIDGCTNGRQAQTRDRPDTTGKIACTPEPAYTPGRVPTDPAALLAYVSATAAAEPEWVSIGAGPDRRPSGFVRLSTDQRAFGEIAAILDRNQLPAVQEAALRAAGRIPGVQVRRNVSDAAGRTGVAVTRTEAGTREELIFDPGTYRYLGHTLIGAELDLDGAEVVHSLDRAGKIGRIRIGPTPEPGQVIYKSALLGSAIVDQAGLRP